MTVLTAPLQGLLVDVDRSTGTYWPDGEGVGKSYAYDNTRLHVLIGRDVHVIRLPKGVHVHPFDLNTVISVDVEIPKGTRLTATLESLGLDAPADSAQAA